MPRHDQNSRRVHRCAWFGIIVAVTTLTAPRSVVAQGEPGTDAPVAPPRASEPVDLAAHRVQTWTFGGHQWVLLSGKAAVLQGAESLRADEILLRITAQPAPEGKKTLFRLDLYAERYATTPGQKSPPGFRVALTTEQSPTLSAYRPEGYRKVNGPPAPFPLLVRSGFMTAISQPVVNPQPSPTNVRNTVPTVAVQQVANSLNKVDPAATRTQVVPRLQDRPAPVDSGGLPGPVEADADAPMNSDLPPPVEPGPEGNTGDELPPPVAAPSMEGPAEPFLPGMEPDRPDSTDLAPLPADGDEKTAAPPLERPKTERDRELEKNPFTPLFPGTQRITRIFPRNGGPNFQYQRLPLVDGQDTVVVRGGVNIVMQQGKADIDISADSVVIWRRLDANGKGITTGPNGEEIEDARQPMEIYLEGNVIVRQDDRKVAGNGDQKTFKARQAFFNVSNERFLALDAEIDMYAPGMVAPTRIMTPRMEQYRPLEAAANGTWVYGLQQIRAEKTVGTGSRFPNPGYRFTSRSIDINRVVSKQTNPNTGKTVSPEDDPDPAEDLTWRIDGRQNVFYMGPVPVFYWPRFVADADDIQPPLRTLAFGTNSYFGQQVLADFNGFRIFGLKKPSYVDIWNVDVDYLSYRTKSFPALGSEIGWFGDDLLNNLADPYKRLKGQSPSLTKDYFGYFDIWGLYDHGNDILGAGPAIITNDKADGNIGIQRGGGGPLGSVPAFTNPRGRVVFRHMQRFLPDDEEHFDEDLRLQVEAATSSDRYFLEEYYKRLWDTGMDEETLLYLIRQKQNWAYTIWTEANLQSWQTETQWLPKLDYYRLGDSFWNNRFTYFQHSGGDYANTHTASEVNNPNIFAFLPYDPISNTSGVLRAGRAYTNHEIDMKLDLGDILRVVPYAQGQAVGWSNQIGGQSMGRVWGGLGVRADIMAYKAYPWMQSELLNVHGINHKIDFEADYRDAFSNVNLNSIGIQDDLDDNTYESVRRYFALTNYAGGILPAQYDPRHLILRRTLSPITGTTDVQAAIDTLHLGIHQRAQTKRGPEGRRRIMDYMTLDLDTTYFPQASRDNFGKPFGQNTYNYQWFIGDRTSIMSYGWFEFFNITGNPIYKSNVDRHDDPFGLNTVTTGVSLSRPPRGNIFIGYSIVDTGPISTSALNTSFSYWLSPKWYGSASSMYDFGNHILLSAMGTLTRIGADYLTTIGLNVDPQRQSYTFAVQITPRLGMSTTSGSAAMANFDQRYAPTQ